MKHFLFIGLGQYHFDLKIEHYKDTRFRKLNEKWLSDEKWKIWSCDPKYYSDEDLQKIKESNWIDCFIQKNICEKWNNVPLFDEWDCTSVLAHVNYDDHEIFFESLIKKIKHDSVGHIHIDLSDHQTETMELLKDPNYASKYYDYHDGKYDVYLNRVTEEKWIEIIDRYFTYHREPVVCKKHRVKLVNVRLKK